MDRRRRKWAAVLPAALAAFASILVASSTSLAGQDDLRGGSVSIQLQSSRGLKLKPASITLPITGGAVDPVDGSGIVQARGAFRAKRGKGKTRVKVNSLALGANGGRGSIAAKVGKTTVANFATLAGGTVARNGWGATISNIRATFTRKGARALNRALAPRRRKGARKSAAGGVKAGQPLGTIVSLTTDPLAVEVVPGSGELVLNTNATGPFVSKLSAHCIDPVLGSPPGVAPIAPATTSGIGGTTYHFPVAGGSAAPDFSAGELLTAGGQAITKNSSLFNPGGCDSAAPPVGTQLRSTEISVAFGQSLLRSIPTLPGGITTPRAPLATIDFSTGSRSVDPATRTLTVNGATVRLADLAAFVLNQTFPTQSGDSSDDFATGDLIGTIDLTAKLR